MKERGRQVKNRELEVLMYARMHVDEYRREEVKKARYKRIPRVLALDLLAMVS